MPNHHQPLDAEMTDVRARLTDALHEIIDEYQAGNITVDGGVDLLLSLPGVDIVEVPEGMYTSVRYDRDAEIARLNATEDRLNSVLDALENRIKIERLQSRDRVSVNELIRLARLVDLPDDPMDPRQPYINKIYLLLADASQGTVDPDRAMNIARRAVTEACDNREGK